MERPRHHLAPLLVVVVLLLGLVGGAAGTSGADTQAACEPTNLATQIALFCAPDMPTAPCCEPVVASVDLGGGVGCLCRVVAQPQLVLSRLNASHLVALYTACGGLRTGGAHLATACHVSSPPAIPVVAPPPPVAPRHTLPPRDASPPATAEPTATPGAASQLPATAAKPLLHGLVDSVAVTTGADTLAACEPINLANKIALFCAPDMPTTLCCELVVASVDLGGDVPCFCRVAAQPRLVLARLNASDLLALYTACGGLRTAGAYLAAVCQRKIAQHSLYTTSRIFGFIGDGVTFLLLCAPMATFYNIIFKDHTVGEYSPDTYLATLMNCALNLLYASPLVQYKVLVLGINLFGVILEGVYVAVYYCHAPESERKKVREVVIWELIILFVVTIIIFAVDAMGTLIGPWIAGVICSWIAGLFCAVFGALMYGSQLTVVKKVWRTENLKSLPFLLTAVSFINAACWATYAWMEKDYFILVPNIVGVLVGIFLLILYFWIFFKKLTRAPASDEAAAAASAGAAAAASAGAAAAGSAGAAAAASTGDFDQSEPESGGEESESTSLL